MVYNTYYRIMKLKNKSQTSAVSKLILYGLLKSLDYRMKDVFGSKWSVLNSLEKQEILEKNLYHQYGLMLEDFSSTYQDFLVKSHE